MSCGQQGHLQREERKSLRARAALGEILKVQLTHFVHGLDIRRGIKNNLKILTWAAGRPELLRWGAWGAGGGHGNSISEACLQAGAGLAPPERAGTFPESNTLCKTGRRLTLTPAPGQWDVGAEGGA